jgi:hypothetical protein
MLTTDYFYIQEMLVVCVANVCCLGGGCFVQACGMWIVAELRGLTVIVSWNKVAIAVVMTVVQQDH